MRMGDEFLEVELEKDNKTLIFYLMLGSVSFLFLGLIGAYGYNTFTSDDGSYSLPLIFYFNTLLILTVSYLLRRNSSREFSKVQSNSRIVFYLLLFFFVFQCVGWWQLFSEIGGTGSQNSIYFLYLLSIVHSLHIIGGIPFHFKYLLQAKKYSRMESNDKSILRHRFKLMHLYWHFLDGLWLVLMIFFVLNMFL